MGGLGAYVLFLKKTVFLLFFNLWVYLFFVGLQYYNNKKIK